MMMWKAAPAGLILALACAGCAHMAPHGETRKLRSTGYPSLDTAAQAGLMTCKFKPALVDGQAVAQWANVQYVWKLD
jgi:hypothetical protein